MVHATSDKLEGGLCPCSGSTTTLTGARPRKFAAGKLGEIDPEGKSCDCPDTSGPMMPLSVLVNTHGLPNSDAYIPKVHSTYVRRSVEYYYIIKAGRPL
jgi:hypothetical protein